jgi:hypothetical protein
MRSPTSTASGWTALARTPAFYSRCTQGGATGFGRGVINVRGLKPATFIAEVPAWQPGDDGVPVIVDNQPVGMTRS